MIRSIVLIGLLAVIFYCAMAGAARADAAATRVTSTAQARLRFLPGMAALHVARVATPAVAATLRAVPGDPSA